MKTAHLNLDQARQLCARLQVILTQAPYSISSKVDLIAVAPVARLDQLLFAQFVCDGRTAADALRIFKRNEYSIIGLKLEEEARKLPKVYDLEELSALLSSGNAEPVAVNIEEHAVTAIRNRETTPCL
jgi:hypothetical protein